MRLCIAEPCEVDSERLYQHIVRHIDVGTLYTEVMVMPQPKAGDTVTASKHRVTPLMCACCLGDHAALQLLLEASNDQQRLAIVNEQSTMGETSLWFAAMAHSPECIKLLLDAGAKPSTQDARGLTPLAAAISNFNPGAPIGMQTQM